MTITVVIPTLNEEVILPLTLSHTLPLGFDEIIVVDGGSQDRSHEIAEGFANSHPSQPPTAVKVITSEPGRATQMNRGAQASWADTLLFLHADTQLPQGAKTAIEEVLADAACIGGRFDVCFERDRGWSWVISRMMNLRSRWSGIASGDQAIFIRRAVFEQIGGFANIPLMEDIDLTRRLKKMGKMSALPHKVITSFRRWETQGPLKTILHMWSLRFFFWIGVSPHLLQRWYSNVR